MRLCGEGGFGASGHAHEPFTKSLFLKDLEKHQQIEASKYLIYKYFTRKSLFPKDLAGDGR
jgi:hypothetical protein